MTRQAVSTENRGVWQSMGSLTKATFQKQSFPLQNTALSTHHQCQKIRHRKLECCQDWVWTSIQEERSKTTKWTVSGRAEMFPMNGFNWSEDDQAVSAAGIPVPLFAAWLASKYILTSVSSTLQFAAISMVTTEMTAGSDRPDHNPHAVCSHVPMHRLLAQWHTHTNYDPMNWPRGHFEK